MRERNKQNTQSSKSSFLQKFAGKLNVLTKEGQIKEQNSLKLPIINSPQSKRSNTMKFRSSKQSLHSFFSDVRTEISLSAFQNNRSGKYFKGKEDRHLTEISNNFPKHFTSHVLKKPGKLIFDKEPLTAIPFVKKQRIEKVQQQVKQPKSIESKKMKNCKVRGYDYETFLNELDSVSTAVKMRKGYSEKEPNDRIGTIHY